MIPQNLKTVKELFSDDPEVLRVLELREQTELLRELAAKKLTFDGVETIKGDPGEPGKDGYTPVKNVDYFNGERGEIGERGPAGRDGVDGRNGRDGKSIPKSEMESMVKDLLPSLRGFAKEKAILELIDEREARVSKSLKTEIKKLTEMVVLNYGGHGGSGGGKTLSVEVPTGTVDGVNTSFTVLHTPVYVEVSGQIMVSQTADPTNYGYSYVVPTITFVNAPLQTPHSFFNG